MKTGKSPRKLQGGLERLRKRVRQLEAQLQAARETRTTSEQGDAVAKALLDASSDAAVLIDAQGTILALNQPAARVLGKGASELVGVCSYDFFPPELAKRRQARVDQVIRTSRPAHWEDQHDGRSLENRVHPIRDAQGKVTRLAIFVRDVTEHKRALEALRESEQRYRFLFDFAPVGIGLADGSGKVLAANRSMLELTGFTQREFATVPLASTYVYPEQRRRLMRQLRERGSVRDYEVTLRRKDGTVYWALLDVELVQMGGQEVLFTTARDISERKRADAELRKQRELLSSILEHIPHCVFWKDTDSVYLGCNRNFARQAGKRSPEEVIGATDRDLAFDKQEAERYRADDREVVRTGRPLPDKEETLVGADGEERTVLTSKVPLRNGSGEVIGVLGIFTDVTDLKRVHQALEQSQLTEQRFREKLTALHRVTNELSLAESLDELCRQAVELGRSELGFDRLSVWFLAENPNVLRGTFGTDESGRTRDEHQCTSPVVPGSLTSTVLADRTRVGVRDRAEVVEPVQGKVVGHAAWALASLWDGRRIIGAISTDNLLTGEPIGESQAELLSLYASALGHLCSRKQAEESLRQGEEAQRRFGERLTALHKVTNELSMAGSFDELCRRAVELGRSELGFDRLGVWFRSGKPRTMRGSFGTDGTGQTCDERDEESPVLPGSLTEEVLKGKLRLAFATHEQFYNPATGWRGHIAQVLASMWDGRQIIGFVSADNLLKGQPITESQGELLSLYASALGHLCSRKRAEESLRQREEAQRRFGDRLTALHKVTNELSMAESFDELCRRAVELGRSELGFDRMGVWFRSDKPGTMRGSFGTDGTGRIRDERDEESPVLPGSLTEEILRGTSRLAFAAHKPFHDRATGLRTHIAQVLASMWDGRQIVGFISADNLLTGQPIPESQGELLSLYASALGHLCSRKRAEESLRQSEEAQRRFGERLTTLHKVTNELSMAGSFDELCRRAVELGRSKLGFDRLGVWFRSDKPGTMRGSFGTDGTGQTCDERDEESPVLPGSLTEEVLKGKLRLAFAPDEPFRNAAGELMGRGTRVLASMWDGQKIVGFISADNLLTAQPIPESQGELLSLYASALGHLCSRKRAEEALRRSEATYRALVEKLPAIIYTAALDPASTTVYVSPQIETYLGYTPEDYAADPDMWRKRVHPEDRDRVIKWVAEAQATGERSVAVYRMIRRDGQVVWFHDEASIACDDAGEPMFLQGVMCDITEQKRAEEELLVRNSAIESSIDPIGLADLKGKVTYVNPAFVKAWGYSSEEEILGKSSVSFWRARTRAREVLKALRTVGSWTGEMVAKRKDATTFHVAVSASMVKDDAGRPVCMMAAFADITERKQAEEAMRQAQRKLTAAREDERRRIAGELHDSVGQGLIALQLGVKGLTQGDGGKPSRARTKRMPALASQCDELVRDVRRICRGLYPPTLEALGLCSALKQLAEDFPVQAAIRVNCSVPPSEGRFPPEVEIALFRIAQEAASNAVRHGRAQRITLSLSYRNGRAVLSVTDNGIGFDPDKVAGKGLGMSMMAERMQAVAGELKISSRPGRTRVAASAPAELIRPLGQEH